MKKRILLLPSWYPDSINPMNGIFIHEQTVALSKHYNVAVLKIHLNRWWRVAYEKLEYRVSFKLVDGIPVYKEPGWVILPRISRIILQSSLKSARRGWYRLLHTWGYPDIIHAHVVMPMGYVATELGLEHNIPVVITEHSSPFTMHLQTEYQRKLVAKTLRLADKVLAVSPALSQTIQSFVPDVIPDVVGNLVRTDFFTPQSETDLRAFKPKLRFLTVGFLVFQKGISILLDAVAILHERGYSEFEVIIGGDGVLRDSLEKQAAKLKVISFCQFIGSLNRVQVRDEMRMCNVFVLPSFHETFGIVVAEAMACGKPVIATQCGGPEFVVTQETGMLVEPGKPEALANAMEKFILGEVKFTPKTIRDSVVRRFGENAFLMNIKSIYDKIL